MKKLAPNWITEGLIDFEYKKYVLLAYLNFIHQNFDEKLLYPFLADLIFHYQNLLSLKENKDKTKESFNKQIKKLDLENFKIEFEKNDERC